MAEQAKKGVLAESTQRTKDEFVDVGNNKQVRRTYIEVQQG